jgi:hypothetical protein
MKLISPLGADIIGIRQSGTGVALIAEVLDDQGKERKEIPEGSDSELRDFIASHGVSSKGEGTAALRRRIKLLFSEYEVQGNGTTEGMYDNQVDYRDVFDHREFVDEHNQEWPECCLRLVEDDVQGDRCDKSYEIFTAYQARREAAYKAKANIDKHAKDLIRICETVLDMSAGKWKGELPQSSPLVVTMRRRMARLAKSVKNYAK